VHLTATAEVQPGAPIEVDGASVGEITSASGPIALGYVKRGTRLEGEAIVGGVSAVIDGPVGA
jgi:hypothetical protein